MIIINQGFDKKTYNIPGIGYTDLKQFQEVNEDSVLGKALLQYFPSICSKSKTVEKEPVKEVEPVKQILTENPIQTADVVLPKVEDETIVEEETIKPLNSFSTKDELEEYGLTFEIQLDKRKTIKKMYDELIQELDKRK